MDHVSRYEPGFTCITWNGFTTDEAVTRSVWASSIKSRPLDSPASGIGSNLRRHGHVIQLDIISSRRILLTHWETSILPCSWSHPVHSSSLHVLGICSLWTYLRLSLCWRNSTCPYLLAASWRSLHNSQAVLSKGIFLSFLWIHDIWKMVELCYLWHTMVLVGFCCDI